MKRMLSKKASRNGFGKIRSAVSGSVNSTTKNSTALAPVSTTEVISPFWNSGSFTSSSREKKVAVVEPVALVSYLLPQAKRERHTVSTRSAMIFYVIYSFSI